ncbi:uncharacterized protein [Fopius arisanus]|uniref:Uncharacterized protein isoform X1 n=2 Tax=Fopius arisanus TaxID=64838 RepID=A0A9R1UBK9_9HYME|nr:PREDICTED: uncharacterized protein LOC105273835 isoform X1 [Fopius arisanus]
MPRKHEVPALQELALCSIGEYVTDFGKSLVPPICSESRTDPRGGSKRLHNLLKSMKHRLSSSIPRHLYNRMALKSLTAIKLLINDRRNTYNDFQPINVFLTEVSVLVNLIEVLLHHNLRSMEFAEWPKIMRHVLYNNLENMSGLEVLDLGSGSAGWRTSEIEKLIINGVSHMPNLLSFTLCSDCTDNIIFVVGETCKKLRALDVIASRSVTDRSIPSILNCQFLKEVKLFRTSVSIGGFSELLMRLPWLENMGRCDDVGEVFEAISLKEINQDKSLALKVLETRNVTIDDLFLFVDVCPFVTSVSIMCDERTDLRILSALEHLQELKLLSCDFYGDKVNDLLEMTNSRIRSLHLEHVEEIDRSALVYISQYCPGIKSLTFYNCDFSEGLSTQFRALKVEPFRQLQRLKCVADCASCHLEFLLSNCLAIKFIQLGSSTGVGDLTMQKVFAVNKMRELEELKILYGGDLSMRTVRLIMENCEGLRRLSELEGWHGVTQHELEAFREELRVNNVDLDTSPTLSLA